jgi:hypothetical protein
MIPSKRLALLSTFVIVIGVSPSSASPIFDFTGTGAGSTATAGRQGTVGWSFTSSIPLTVDGLGLWDQTGSGLREPQTVGLWTSSGELLSTAIVGASSTPVPSSSSAGQWLFTSVTPFVLSPGDYVLGALYATSSLTSDGVRITPSAPVLESATALADSAARDAVVADVLFSVVEQLATSYGLSSLRTADQAVISLRADDLQDSLATNLISTTSFTTMAGVAYTGAKAGAGTTLTFPSEVNMADGFGPNLSVQAVPEPFSLALLGAGLVAFAVRRYAFHA